MEDCNGKIKVSVVVPVYNSEHYLRDCIHSLQNQSFSNIEFIFINDGSIDSSLDILKEFQKIDNRIVVYSQENKGVSAARNKGIELAKGEYIGFVDADDTVSNDYFEKLYFAIKDSNTDFSIASFQEELNGHINVQNVPFPKNVILDKDFIQSQIIPFVLQQDDLNSCCTKFFNTSFLKENKIEFPEDLKHGEDATFVLQSFACSKSVVFSDTNGYLYREVIGSATRNINHKNYFKIAISKYEATDVFNLNLEISSEEILKLKSIRLIKTLVSLFSIYTDSKEKLSFQNQYAIINKIVSNTHVCNIMKSYFKELKQNTNTFVKFILYCIKYKFVFGILVAVKYSHYRNK